MYAIVNGALRWLYDQAARVPAETVGGRTIFKFAPISYFVFGVALISGLGLLVVGLVLKDRFCMLFGGIFVIGSVAGWPNVIYVDDLGLTSSQLLHRDKQVLWGALHSAEFNTANRLTKITATDGTRLYHTGFHCDPRLLHELIASYSPRKLDYIEPTWLGHEKSRTTERHSHINGDKSGFV